jgi:hypothetical protein
MTLRITLSNYPLALKGQSYLLRAIRFCDQEVGILTMAFLGANKPPYIPINILTECSL